MAGAETLIDAAIAGATVVTRTDRLARELRVRVTEARADKGKNVAQASEILTFGGWIESAWERGGPDALLLSGDAERLVWESVIKEDVPGLAGAGSAELFNLAGLADSAATAWERVCSFGTPAAALNTTAETQAFARWRAAFARRCSEGPAAGGWKTRAELPGLVCGLLEAGSIERPDRLIFAGFDSLEPGIEAVAKAVEKRGGRVERLGVGGGADDGDAGDAGQPSGAGQAAAPLCIRYETQQQEILGTAERIIALLREQPKARVGIVAVDLSSYRPLLERYLGAALDPDSLLRSGTHARRVFDLAGAPALSDYGLVGTCLDVLSLDDKRANSFSRVSRILMSRYPRAGERRSEEVSALARARVEARLRDKNRLRIGLSVLERDADHVGAKVFAEAVAKLRAELNETPLATELPPNAWAQRFAFRLVVFGYGAAGLDADERVVFGRWRQALSDLHALETVCPLMTGYEALKRLRKICARRLVQGASGGWQVQAMGLLDTVGLEFDAMFVLGMNAASIPAAPRPHPLLPVQWQRDNGMPFASAEVELSLARTRWQALLTSAPSVTVSFAEQSASGEDHLASPLIADLVATDIEQPAGLWYLAADEQARAGRVEPRVEEGQTASAQVRSGGTSVLRDYSNCHFHGAATARLRARPLDEPEPQPRAMMRGNLVHETLEAFWGWFGTQVALAEALPEQIVGAINAAAARALDRAEKDGLPRALRASLARWLYELIEKWLEIELAREDNFAVTARELEVSLELAPSPGETFTLGRIKIDRIDTLDDGSEVVIDYKTGAEANTWRKWYGDRPDDLQLPLYAVARKKEGMKVHAVAFGNLCARDKVSLNGPPDIELVGRAPTSQERDNWTSWEDALAAFETKVTALAAKYLAGDVSINPDDARKACRFCDLPALCRINEIGGVFEGNDENEGVARDDD